jgi:probable phosphoglycerate mutase
MDVPLSEAGRTQARALRARLDVAAHAHLFDDAQSAVVTSDLCRAHETAEIAFGGAGRVLHARRALREFCYGVFEGLTRHEIEERFPGAMAAWVHGDHAFAIDGGESRAAVYMRARAAVLAFLAEVRQHHVVVVGHGGVMRQLVSACFGERSEPWNLSFTNTATHIVRVEPARWIYAGQL